MNRFVTNKRSMIDKMLDINLKQLEAFVATVDYSSFTKAGEMLYLTQSTVSSHISALESQLKLRLIQRGARRKVELTPEGRPVYEAAKDILARCQALQNIAGGKNSLQLAVGASSVPGQYLLPDILSGFLAGNPDCKYSLMRGDSALIHQMLDQDKIHIGFVGAAIDRKQYHYHALVGDRLVLITANTEVFRKKHAAGIPGRDLLTQPMILREESSGTRKAMESYLARCGVPRESLNTVALIDNPEALKSSVIRGLGVSVVSGLSVRDEVASGKLLSFDLDSGGVYRNIYMVTARDNALSMLEQQFVDFVIQFFSRNNRNNR